MAFPVHDWITTAARYIWLTAVAVFGNPVLALTVFLTAVLVYWGDISPASWLLDYVPDLPSISGLVNFANINSDIMELGCYVSAADVAATLIDNLLTTLTAVADFTCTFLPALLIVYLSFVAVHATLKFMQRFRP